MTETVPLVRALTSRSLPLTPFEAGMHGDHLIDLDVVAVAHLNIGVLGQRILVVDDVDRDHLELARAVVLDLQLDHAVDLGDDGLVLGHARLEELLDARQALRDVVYGAGDAAGVEGTHGELRARLADGLRGDDAHRVARRGQATLAEVAPVARAADAVRRKALQHRAAIDLRDARGDDGVDHLVLELRADRDVLEAGHRRCQHATDRVVAERLAHVLALGLGDPDALGRAAVVEQDDHVLRHVDQAAGQVAGFRGAQGGVGQTLAGAVAGDEVLHHGQAVAEVAAHRHLHDAPRRVGHQAAHAGELADLLELRLGRARVGDGVDRAVRVEHRLDTLLNLF